MTKRRSAEKVDAFSQGGATDDWVYDGDGLESLTPMPVTASHVPIMQIRPDIAQPRRAIPSMVRGGWDGDAQMVRNLLALWLDYAERECPLDIEGMLTESSDATYDEDGEVLVSPLPDDLSPIAKGFVELVQLAADIRRVGLTNPITVAREGDGYVIIAGERRWLAHHLLYWYSDYGETIPCFVKPKRDVWAQASENANRSPLNAIGMARQVAILIMAMYEEVQGTVFQPFHELVKPGESDLAYYAQVADGREWRVLDGYAEKLTTATGLPSPKRVRDYRRLLRLDAEMWAQADTEDWSERKIADTVSPRPEQSVRARTLSDESFEQVAPPKSEITYMDESPEAYERELTSYHDRNDSPDATDHRTEADGSLSVPTEMDEYEVPGTPKYLLSEYERGLVRLMWQFIQAQERDDDEVFEGDTLRWRWDIANLTEACVWLQQVADDELPIAANEAAYRGTVGQHVRELLFAVDLLYDQLVEIGNELQQRGREHVEESRK